MWAYTSAAARPIAYAVGQFRYLDTSSGDTRLAWTYGFQLKPNALLGRLGPLGRFLFRRAFLDSLWARVMANTLSRMKAYVETAPAA